MILNSKVKNWEWIETVKRTWCWEISNYYYTTYHHGERKRFLVWIVLSASGKSHNNNNLINFLIIINKKPQAEEPFMIHRSFSSLSLSLSICIMMMIYLWSSHYYPIPLHSSHVSCLSFFKSMTRQYYTKLRQSLTHLCGLTCSCLYTAVGGTRWLNLSRSVSIPIRFWLWVGIFVCSKYIIWNC